jgi:hypothetical protein
MGNSNGKVENQNRGSFLASIFDLSNSDYKNKFQQASDLKGMTNIDSESNIDSRTNIDATSSFVPPNIPLSATSDIPKVGGNIISSYNSSANVSTTELVNEIVGKIPSAVPQTGGEFINNILNNQYGGCCGMNGGNDLSTLNMNFTDSRF